jgi:glyoxylase-like metal-dependent hydrolase (beta-lactamase superfamily II)
MDVGELRIDPVMDGTARFPASAVYVEGVKELGGGKGAADEDWNPHRNLIADDGMLELALGGFLVRHGDTVALVDTGVGLLDAAGFKGGMLIDSLAKLGVAPGEVTDVLFTHLHFDHVGWATSKGAVVFPNATYRCHEHDWEHFFGPDDGATRKLTPVADRMELWSTDGTILPGMDTMTAPGHTPGSTIVVLSSGDARAMLLGDVVHCPVELLDDEWAGLGDVDPALAKRTRNALARELEGTDIPAAAAHFPGLEFGRLLAGEGTRRWVV